MWWVVKFKIPIAQVCGYHPRKLLFSYIQIFLFLKVTTFRKCSCLIFLYIIGYDNIFRSTSNFPQIDKTVDLLWELSFKFKEATPGWHGMMLIIHQGNATNGPTLHQPPGRFQKIQKWLSCYPSQ